jgi:hypothetical protein
MRRLEVPKGFSATTDKLRSWAESSFDLSRDLPHRHFHIILLGEFDSFFVAGVGVADQKAPLLGKGGVDAVFGGRGGCSAARLNLIKKYGARLS